MLAVTLAQWSAQATAAPADHLSVNPPSLLVDTSVRRFAHEFGLRLLPTDIQWESSIPREVGLAGSSALVIAALRAVGNLYSVDLEPPRLAALALAVEAGDLGIAAGPQDRVAQAYGGVMFMDFAPDGLIEQLDPKLLPPLLIAWRADARGGSGSIHASLARRYAAGERLTHETMARLADLARGARSALLELDLERFGQCVDGTFDLREQLLALDPRSVEMIHVARECGASANYTGSGGAIVAVSPERGQLEAAEQGLQGIGCQTEWVEDAG